MYQSFTELPVWKLSMELSVKLFHLTSTLPRSEDYGLTSQIRRAANSISANIAEAFGRESFKEKHHFYTYSRGSAYEIQSHLNYGFQVGYFEENKLNERNGEIDEIIFQLSKVIKTLREK